MLNPFFSPQGVAVIGASRDPHKLGYGIIRNLLEYHFKGAIYPVNPKAREVLGQKCYSSILKVPEPVDLAVVIVASKFVVQAVKDCGERGIKNLIIPSGGFGETGEEGLAREREIVEFAKENDIRIIGPNCIGTIDTHTPVNTTFVHGMPKAGEIGFLSHSGAMCAAVIDWARGAGVGFSRIVSLGNQIDVNETEMLTAMANDSATKVITAYIEGVSEGRSFMKVAQKTSLQKPLVVIKGGKGESGAKAVASHTGALAGSSEAFDAACKHSGVLQAKTTEELFDWARALAWQPLPKGKRIAILTNAGGPAILAVDAFEAAGLELAHLTDETRAFLKPRIPIAGSIKNPIDILAGSGPGTYAVALDALLADPTVDIAVVIQAPQDWFLPASLAEVVGEVASTHEKPVFASIMGKASVDQALAILHQRKIPNFSFPERVVSTLNAMLQRKKWLEKNTLSEEFFELNPKPKIPFQNGIYSEIFTSYGIEEPKTVLAKTVEEAISIAEDIGFPVALKLSSPEFSHKTDVGGVVLDIKNSKELKNSFEGILAKIKSVNSGAKINGILVQQMLVDGQEVIVGFKRDSQFGAMLLVGSGGVEVELLKDFATGTIPLKDDELEELLDSTLAGKRLNGWRGTPPFDKKSVIDSMKKVSQIAIDYPEISELEINPLYVLENGKGAFAVDIRGN